MSTSTPVRLIAIVGGSGAGKGWLVNRLRARLGDCACHLQLDDFYRDRSHLPAAERAQLNFDVPDAIDWAEAERVLRDCRAGRPTCVPHYDFASHCRVAARERTGWRPQPIVLVDGLWLLHAPAIAAMFDLRIFVDTPTEVRCARRLARDVAERGYPRELVERQLRTAVLPMHERHVEPQKAFADLLLADPVTEAELDDLAHRITSLAASEPALAPAP